MGTLSQAPAIVLVLLLAAGCARMTKVSAPSPVITPAPAETAPAPEAAPPPPPAPRAAPTSPPTPAAVAPERPAGRKPPPAPPAPPPPVVSPQMPPPEEERLRREAGVRIEGTERLLVRIDSTKLAPEQQEVLSTIQSFLAKARAAISERDFERAFNLADKAGVLAQDLSRAVR